MRVAARVRVGAEAAQQQQQRDEATASRPQLPVQAVESAPEAAPAEPVGAPFSLEQTPIEPLPMPVAPPALRLLPGGAAELERESADASGDAEPPAETAEAPLAEAADASLAGAPLAEAAATDPALPMPDRVAAEMALGQPLTHLRVFSGTATREALGSMDAEGAASGADVFVSELPHPGSAPSQQAARATLAHEVMHAADTAPPPPSGESPLAAAAREQAAEESGSDLAAAVQAFHQPEPEVAPPPPPVDRSAAGRAAPAAGGVGLRRSATQQPATPPPPAVETADATKRPRTAGARPPAPGAAARGEVGEAPPEQRPRASDRAGAGRGSAEAPAPDSAEAAEGEGLSELPPVAGSREVDVAAPAPPPLEGRDVDGLTAAFASAPPSQKAFSQNTLSERLDAEAGEAASQKSDALPDLEKKMGGEGEAAEVDGSLLDPGGGEAAGLDVDDEPLPDAEAAVAETPDNEEFAGNDGLYGWLRGLFGTSSASNAESIDEAIENVETVDASVETTPGAPPPVPLEGATDPALIDQKKTEGVGQASTGQGEARSAVEQGPGPEVVQPRDMQEPVEIPAIEQTPIERLPAVDGIEQYKQVAPPAEVQAAFDEQNAAAMEASLGEAKSEVDQATSKRDEDWDQAVADAQQDNQDLVDTAQRDQEAAVDEQRTRIQEERQHTLDRQQQEVDRVSDDAGEIEADKQGEIDDRVAADEAEIEQKYDDAEKKAEAEVESGQDKADKEKRKAEREAESQSWWDRIASWISDAISALVDAVTALVDRVADAVNRILDGVRSLVVGLIELAADFIKAAISAFGELLKGLVDALLGEIFPELAEALKGAIDGAVELAHQGVDAAAQEMVDGVNAVLDGVQGALNAVLDAFKGAIMLAGALISAALTGDWGEVARLLLEGALSVAGISPDEFYAFIGEVKETFDTIVNDPMGFLGNVFGAIALGFNQFIENILEHLQTGFFEWLVGPLGEMGITLPTTWDIWSILGLILEVLGLTREGIRGVLVEELGEGAGAVFDHVLRYVDALIAGGWQGLWEQVKSDLSDLWSVFVDGIKDWTITKIIQEATLKLLSLLDPTGISAIVQVVLTGYRIYTFVRDNLQRMAELVSTLVGSIHDIAMGTLKPAGDAIEAVLGRLVPVAISLLANLFGIGGVTAKVREIIEGIRERVRNALRSLIRRVKGLFTGGSEATEGAEGEDAGAWWNVTEPYTTEHDRESHTAEVQKQGNDAVVVVRSDPTTLRELASAFDDLPPEKRQAANEAAGRDGEATMLAELQEIQGRIDDHPEVVDAATATEQRGEITDSLRVIIRVLTAAGLPGRHEENELEPSQVFWTTMNDRAHRVIADPLTPEPGNTKGRKAEGELQHKRLLDLWVTKKVTYREGGTQKVPMFTDIVGAHLLHHELHGPTEPWNIANAKKNINSDMKVPEQEALKAKRGSQATPAPTDGVVMPIRYETIVRYHRDAEPPPKAWKDGTEATDSEIQDWVGYFFAREVNAIISWNRDESGKYHASKPFGPYRGGLPELNTETADLIPRVMTSSWAQLNSDSFGKKLITNKTARWIIANRSQFLSWNQMKDYLQGLVLPTGKTEGDLKNANVGSAKKNVGEVDALIEEGRLKP